MKVSFKDVSVLRGREYSLEEAERVWLISDLHLGHKNIIRYCHRPFRSVEEMNALLLRNWNDTVAIDDLVYFLGDMSFGRDSGSPRDWVARLSGRIVWVKGSHDRGIRPTSIVPGVMGIVLREVIYCGDIEFLLIHDTFDAVASGWTGWVIHGHSHEHEPFIRLDKQRVNVSVEAIGYRPISLAQIVREVKR